MPNESNPSASPYLEMAHVLFMDIVAYSQLPIDEQTRLIGKLQHVVRNTAEFGRAQKRRQLLRLPTGDGMALLFFGDAEAPARCAIEISRALRDHAELKLRMGVHTGPVQRVEDINANRNVAGGGINIAQRVMDCGDAGHILVSSTQAEVLGHLTSWIAMLHDLGEAEVKHGVRVHLYNLYSEDAGNPEVPKKISLALRYQDAADVGSDLKRLKRDTESARKVGTGIVPDLVADQSRRREGSPIRKSQIVTLSAGALIALVAGVFLFDVAGLRDRLLHHGAALPKIESIAVLPLANLSGDPQQEYFADGMTDELIGELSRIGSLKVISRTSVMQYKGEKKKSLSQIGRELDVNAVMEGSVLRSGNQVRIAAHMIYAPTDQNLMTETYERDLGDVLKLQREVAESIMQQVRLKLTPEQKARFQQAGDVKPEAYQSYLSAIALDESTYQGIKKAQSYAEEAIQKDPGFAPAYFELARSYINFGQFRWLSPKDAYPPAKEALHKALELDEKNCRAHWGLGWLSWRYDWDWQTVEKEYRHAFELCPNNAQMHWERAYYLGWSGRGAEAMSEAAKTRELDPLMPNILECEALINYHLRNYKAMIEIGRPNVAASPNFWVSHYLLGVGYEGSGQALEAIPEYQKAVELSQGNSDATAALAHAYAATGRKAEAQKILHEWLGQSKTSYVSPYMIATVYSSLGEKDKAFEYLERAYQERSSDLPYFLKADLRMDSLRPEPRFQDLMRRMNFPTYPS